MGAAGEGHLLTHCCLSARKILGMSQEGLRHPHRASGSVGVLDTSPSTENQSSGLALDAEAGL